MSQVKTQATEIQKQTAPARQLEQEATRQPEQGPVQLVAPQAAYRRSQVSWNGLRPADLLALQRTVGNRQVQRLAKRLTESEVQWQAALTVANAKEDTVQQEAAPRLTQFFPPVTWWSRSDPGRWQRSVFLKETAESVRKATEKKTDTQKIVDEIIDRLEGYTSAKDSSYVLNLFRQMQPNQQRAVIQELRSRAGEMHESAEGPLYRLFEDLNEKDKDNLAFLLMANGVLPENTIVHLLSGRNWAGRWMPVTTEAGGKAAQFYADLVVEGEKQGSFAKQAMGGIGGFFSSLWTPQTAGTTVKTLTLARYAQLFPRTIGIPMGILGSAQTGLSIGQLITGHTLWGEPLKEEDRIRHWILAVTGVAVITGGVVVQYGTPKWSGSRTLTASRSSATETGNARVMTPEEVIDFYANNKLLGRYITKDGVQVEIYGPKNTPITSLQLPETLPRPLPPPPRPGLLFFPSSKSQTLFKQLGSGPQPPKQLSTGLQLPKQEPPISTQKTYKEFFNELTALRRNLNLPTTGNRQERGVLTVLEVNGKSYYGRNSWAANDDIAKQAFLDAGLVNSETGRAPVHRAVCNHAEGETFLNAFKGGQKGFGRLFIDSRRCGFCRTNVPALSKTSQINPLEIYELRGDGKIQYTLVVNGKEIATALLSLE